MANAKAGECEDYSEGANNALIVLNFCYLLYIMYPRIPAVRASSLIIRSIHSYMYQLNKIKSINKRSMTIRENTKENIRPSDLLASLVAFLLLTSRMPLGAL